MHVFYMLVSRLAATAIIATTAHMAAAQCGLSLVSQPLDQAHCPSTPFVFSVSATGDGVFEYQWQWRRQGQTTWRNITTGFNSDSVASFMAVTPRSAEMVISLYKEGHWAWMPLIGEFQ